MTQLIVNGLVLPQTSNDKYSCWEEQLAVSVTMASGRQVTELRGKVYRIQWSYDYLGAILTNAILSALRSGQPLMVDFLPDNGTELLTSSFWVSEIQNPTFAFAHNGDPLWHNIGFSLREVNPHD